MDNSFDVFLPRKHTFKPFVSSQLLMTRVGDLKPTFIINRRTKSSVAF